MATSGSTAPPPVIIEHDDVLVVRDDLFPGGTKARFLSTMFEGAGEVAYASPAEGGAQLALATVARLLGKRATIFVARRAKPHPRTIAAAQLGAKIVAVAPGYLSMVQARAREYCTQTGARLMPFGGDMPGAINAIAAAARAIGSNLTKFGVHLAQAHLPADWQLHGRRRSGMRYRLGLA